MSLNGLDDTKIDEAFQAAVAEPGAWFLLKYIARDEVDLLARGHGGVAEFRENVAAYTEQSPLYGFLRYRRRTVLIKYVPEGTSRLLRARVAVHFQAVSEKFTPHDTIFTIAAPMDLKETSLSGACSLHTASASTSSSNSSLQQKRLTEIAEDAEETRTVNGDSSKPLPPLPPHLQPENGRDSSRPSVPVISFDDSVDGTNGATSNHNTSASSNEPPYPSSIRSHGSSTADTITITSLNEDRRISLNSVRPKSRDLHTSHAYGSRPKVKLGPRPSLDIGGRPQTSGSGYRQFEPRPVASLPAGIRMAPRKKSVSEPPSIQQSVKPITLPAPPPAAPEMPRYSTALTPRPLTSSGSIRSIATSTFTVAPATPRTPAMTPEKQRLMKAVKMRQKRLDQMAKAQEAEDQAIEDHHGQESKEQASLVDEPTADGAVGARPDSDLKDTVETPAAIEDLATATPETSNSIQALESMEDNTVGESESNAESTADKTTSYPNSPHESPDLASTKASSVSETMDRQDTELSDQQSRTPTAGDAHNTEAPQPGDTAILDTKVLEDPHLSSLCSISASDSVTDGLDHVEDALAPIENSRSGPATDKQARDTDVPQIDSLQSDHDSQVQAIDATTPQVAISSVEDQERSSTALKTDDQPVIPKDAHGAGEEGAPSDESSEQTTPSALPQDRDSNITISVTPSLRKRQRRPNIDPIKTDVSPDQSDDNLLSDDSLMDELNEATVQEAQPVSVRKSPLSPYFGGDVNESGASRENLGSRAVSSHSVVTGSEESGSRPSSQRSHTMRTSSGTILSVNKSRQGPIAMIKKVNVSSGISQRIKALEKFTSQSGNPITPPLSTSSTPRKSSLRSPPSGGSLNALPIMRNKVSPSQSPAMSTDSFALPIQSTQVSTEKTEDKDDLSQTESVSVKAKIIRESDAPTQHDNLSPRDPKTLRSLELRDSPLTIEHHKASLPTSNQKPLISPVAINPPAFPAGPSPQLGSPMLAESRRPSVASAQSISSIGRNRAKSPPPSSNSSVNGEDGRDSKRESAKSRFFRRVSSISNSSRKSIVSVISPTVREEDPDQGRDGIVSSKRRSIDVGEVNVQFPDSLVRAFLSLIAIDI
ncbi:MAG: hypothetical protein M1825_001987 [Sarcosagium campestre]|nr:MAG: hypothetical protein M1825_001987 [Sarcosagium campestre]